MKLGNINLQDKLTRAGAIAAGSVAAVAINNKLVPMVIKPQDGAMIDTKLSNGITMAVGIFGPDLIGGKKGRGKAKQGDFIQQVGDGIVAAATLNLAEEFFPGFMDKIGALGGGYPSYGPEYLGGYAGEQFENAVAGQDAYAAQDKHVS